MTPEGRVKARIKKILKELDVYYVMPMTGGYGNSGVPDFICCIGGRFVGIEAKANKGRLTALQEHNIEQIRQRGGDTLVINEVGLEFLKARLLTILAIHKTRGDFK